jgi:hypothetical protein
MSIGRMLLVTGIVLTVARVLRGRHCWFFAVEALARLATVALLSSVAA